MRTRIAAALAATFAMVAAAIAIAPAASAAPRDGSCQTGEFCLYYRTDHAGSKVDLVSSTRDYGTGAGCVKFVSSGAGKGQCVKNNTASVWNRTTKPVFVFYNSDFGGVYHRIAAGAKVNLNSGVKNNNASQIIGDASLRFPLRTTQAKIKARSPHWCYSSNANCHHDYNASDIFAATGTPVVSPVAGTVKSVTRASSGVGSRVTIKDSFGRLWYFAHMHHEGFPMVKVGQKVTKGQQIGKVGTSAHAVGTSPHVHVDMRAGVDFRVACSGAACVGKGFVNDQPLLRAAFGQLATS